MVRKFLQTILDGDTVSLVFLFLGVSSLRKILLNKKDEHWQFTSEESK